MGELTVFDGVIPIYSCATLELPWLNNQRQKSCIPAGVYNVRPRTSETFGQHFHIQNVPDRSHILIHSGNFAAGDNVQTLGCVLVGRHMCFQDINKDGHKDVVHSRQALERLRSAAPDGFRLTVVN